MALNRASCLMVGLSVLGLALTAACSEDSASTTPATPGKYEQTWGASYSATTCADWSTQMDDHQRWAAAADMLAGARNKGDGGEGLPVDALVDEFEAGISTACVEPTMSLTDVSVGLYLTERERFRP